MSVFGFLDFRKVGKFAASIERPKARSVSADQGLCQWTLLGPLPPNPCYRLALGARHGLPPTFKYLPQSLVIVCVSVNIRHN